MAGSTVRMMPRSSVGTAGSAAKLPCALETPRPKTVQEGRGASLRRLARRGHDHLPIALDEIALAIICPAATEVAQTPSSTHMRV